MQGNYSWGLTEDLFDANLQLKDINLNIKKGEFVCVIGDVGAGKSSILNALNGDMIYVPTSVVNEFNGKKTSLKERQYIIEESQSIADAPIKVAGSVCYAEQQPWIQNMTIRDNILFGLPLDEQRYTETIMAC